jgi:anti-anti-sigma regulatory factor
VANLEFSIQESADAIVISLNGKIGAAEVQVLEKIVATLKGRSQRSIIFDFTSASTCVTFAAFQVIFRLYRRAKRNLAVVGLKADVREKMIREGVAKESEVFDTLQAALSEYGSP